jgi:hypothetical protein
MIYNLKQWTIITLICFFATGVNASTYENRHLNHEADALYKAVSGVEADAASYPDVDAQYLQRLYPPMRLYELNIDNLGTKELSVYDRGFKQDDIRWHVTAVFNQSDNPVNICLNLDSVWGGIGKQTQQVKSNTTNNKYLLYDVINKQVLGGYEGYADIRIEPESARLISIRLFTGYPQILSIGNHIGQGYFELKDISWDKPISMITAITKGLNNKNTSIRLYIPQGWKIRSTAINEKSGSWEEYHPDMIRFDVPDASGETTWHATFDGSLYIKPKSRPVNKSALVVINSVISE